MGGLETRRDGLSHRYGARYDCAIDRRDDVRVDQIELLRVDQRLIGLHRPLVLLDEIDLILFGLSRDRVLPQQRLVAGQVDFRLVEQSLVVYELALVLRL